MGFEAKPLTLSPGDLIMKRICVTGSQQNGREYLHEALDFAAKGKAKTIAETYSERHQQSLRTCCRRQGAKSKEGIRP